MNVGTGLLMRNGMSYKLSKLTYSMISTKMISTQHSKYLICMACQTLQYLIFLIYIV